MKKVLLSALAAFLTISFPSCGGSDGDGGEAPSAKYKVHDGNIVGVWKSGDKAFVSFSSDGFNSSLLSNTFIDEGDYSVNGDTITVTNKYFGSTTKYVVNSISDKEISLTADYDDLMDGYHKNAPLRLTKTSDKPCTKDNGLVGKSYHAQYASSSGSQYWSKEFTTYNSVSCTRTNAARYDPATLYYVYLPPKIYFYVIQNNAFRYNTVRYDEIRLDDNNQIVRMNYLFGEKMY